MKPKEKKLRGSERLSSDLMELITQGRLKPGDRLPTEQELVKQYNTSRITVREALSVLSGIGVIDNGLGERRRIRKLDSSIFGRLFSMMIAMESDRTFHEIFQVRRALESTSVKAAALNRSEEQLSLLEKNIESYRESLESDSEDIERQRRCVELDCSFHLLIAEMSGNVVLVALMETLSSYVSQVQLRSCIGELSRNWQALEAHERIHARLAKSDPEGAAIEMAHHLQVSEEDFPKTAK